MFILEFEGDFSVPIVCISSPSLKKQGLASLKEVLLLCIFWKLQSILFPVSLFCSGLLSSPISLSLSLSLSLDPNKTFFYLFLPLLGKKFNGCVPPPLSFLAMYVVGLFRQTAATTTTHLQYERVAKE